MSRRMKALVLSFTTFILATAYPALAGYSYCESWYQNGEECTRECWHYADDGTYLGHVYMDYHC